MVDSLYIKQTEANVCSGTITHTFATSSCKAKRNHPNICWNFVATRAQLRIGSAFQILGIGLIKYHSYILYCIGLLNKRVEAFKLVPKRALQKVFWLHQKGVLSSAECNTRAEITTRLLSLIFLILRLQEQQNFRNLEFRRKILEFIGKSFHVDGKIWNFPSV